MFSEITWVERFSTLCQVAAFVSVLAVMGNAFNNISEIQMYSTKAEIFLSTTQHEISDIWKDCLFWRINY